MRGKIGHDIEEHNHALSTHIRVFLTKHKWMSLSPIFIFFVVYIVSSICVHDFYAIPIVSAFLLASIYALLISPEKGMNNKIEAFSVGAGNTNIVQMIWIFILAGAFAATAKGIGAIDATVNLTLYLLPTKFVYASLFIAACFISMAIGTSVGTIVALIPIATGMAADLGTSIPYMAAIITGGAFFGDNLSFISDTTIAATRTQGCDMADKFKYNLRIALPAALIVTVIYVWQGLSVELTPTIGEINWICTIPYLLIIVMALMGIHVTYVLSAGLCANLIIGCIMGNQGWIGWLQAVGSGIENMGALIIVTMLAGGMLELIRRDGGLDYILHLFNGHIKGQHGAELSIACLVCFANICTANNTIAILTVGDIAKTLTQKYGLNPKRTASLLDTFSCFIQGIIPYGAQLMIAAGLAGVSSFSIISHLYYPFTLGIVALLAILIHFKRTKN